MRLGRLLAAVGVGYGAYRWLRNRPQTMGQVKDALRGVGAAARKGDLGGARTALTDLGQAIGGERSVRQAVDRVQQAVSSVVGPQGRALPIDARTAAGVIPTCAALVQAGRLAHERGTTLAIRNLGERLAVQFDQIGSQLREAGRDVPQGLDDAGQQLTATLSDLSGHLFDQAFLDESLNAIIRILDTLPEQTGGLGTQLRQLQADVQRLGETIHRRSDTMPGPGTTVAIEKDRS